MPRASARPVRDAARRALALHPSAPGTKVHQAGLLWRRDTGRAGRVDQDGEDEAGVTAGRGLVDGRPRHGVHGDLQEVHELLREGVREEGEQVSCGLIMVIGGKDPRIEDFICKYI